MSPSVVSFHPAPVPSAVVNGAAEACTESNKPRSGALTPGGARTHIAQGIGERSSEHHRTTVPRTSTTAPHVCRAVPGADVHVRAGRGTRGPRSLRPAAEGRCEVTALIPEHAVVPAHEIDLDALEYDIRAVFAFHGVNADHIQVNARHITQACRPAGVTVTATAYQRPAGLPAVPKTPSFLAGASFAELAERLREQYREAS